MARQICPCGHEQLGYIIRQRVLSQQIHSQHYLVQEHGLAVQKNIVDYHEQDFDMVLFVDAERGREFRASRYQLIHHATTLRRGEEDWLILGFEYWSITNLNARQLRLL